MGPIHGGRSRSGVWLVGVLCTVFLLTASSPARSASPELLWQAPSFGADQSSSLAGKLYAPRAVAASPVDGHVFVLEHLNARVSEFTSWGTFVKAWGWGVRDGADELQTCTAESGCRAGRVGDGPGQFDGTGTSDGSVDAPAHSIAVDQAGDVWVGESYAEGAKDFRVQKFSPAGEFLLMIGREVDKTTGGNICTAVSGDVCGNGLPGTGEREFSDTRAIDLDRMDIDAAGTVFIGDGDRIQALNSDGSFSGEITLQGKLAGESIRSLAVDPVGGFYLSLAGLAGVRRIDSTGTEIAQLPVTFPGAVATDVAGDLYVIAEGLGLSGEDEVLEFRPDGSCAVCAGERFATPAPNPGSSYPPKLAGVATNVIGPGLATSGDVYASSALNEGSQGTHISAYGPIPHFESPPLEPSEVRGEFASTVATSTASLQAEVNPRFSSQTTYLVEYGAENCGLGGCTATDPQALGAERNVFALTNPIELSGLQPGTVYHYRFVATSGSLSTAGEDRTFTTHSPSTAVLPDGRAYEMVSPPNKSNGEVGNPETVSSALLPIQASPSGEAITYASLAAFGGNPQSATGGSQYVSRRTPQGWTTENVSPPDQEGYLSPPVQAFSEDLATAAIGVKQPPLVPGAPEGFENLYLRDSAGGALRLLTGTTPTFVSPTASDIYCLTFEGASSDFSRVFFVARGALTPDASTAEGFNLYEWSAAEGLRVVSVLPNGSVATAAPKSGFGAHEVGGCELGYNVTKNAISADGSRVYWSREVGGASTILYLRLNASETVQVDKVQGGGGPSGNGQFRAASSDGSIAFFTAPGKLTAGSGSGALYRFDLAAEAGGRLTAITPGPAEGKVRGVLGASEDGRRIYFAADGSFAPGAEAGNANLYLWEEGAGLRYITTLADADASDWQAEPSHQTARTTPDGSSLAFLSTVPLTGFDNTDQATGKPDPEVFLYNADTDRISCASCNPTGARPIGRASLPIWNRPFQQPRYLSNDGRRLFFTTADALDLHDVNRKQDVYEFEQVGTGDCTVQLPTYAATDEGCIGLISPGNQNALSTLVDASSDGRDVFFGTPQRLVDQDVDENFDIYDARVGGGFPPPTPPPSSCSGDSCRSPASAPAATAPGSSNYAGPGNQNPAKHKHRRKHKHHHKHHRNRHHEDGRSSR